MRGLCDRPWRVQNRRKTRASGHPRAREGGQPLFQDHWSIRLSPAPGQDDRWPPKERSLSWEQLCAWRRPAGWSTFLAPARSMSAVWGPGPRQQQDFILVTKDGKVQVINYWLAGQPASPSGRPAGRRPLQGQCVPLLSARGGRSGGGGSEAQWGGGGERKGVSGPGFRARLAK